MIHNSFKNNTLQEYSIVERYGITLYKLLDKNVKYSNMTLVLQFMQNFLKGIHSIHENNYAHLDLKPDNILFKNIQSVPKKPVHDLDFAIFDFGGAAKFTNDKSKKLAEQMASPAKELMLERKEFSLNNWIYIDQYHVYYR